MKKRNSTIRISYIGIICIVLLFALIIAKMIYVSNSVMVDGIDIKAKAASRTTTKRTLTANRGNIYSTNGEVLAKDVNAYKLIAYLEPSRTKDESKPRHVVDKEYTANVLSSYLNVSPEYILERLNTNGAYQVEFGAAGKDLSEKTKLEIQALDLPGIDFIAGKKRYYPYGDFASYIIGYSKKKENEEGIEEIVGELGVEGYYNNELTGTNGYTIYDRDAYGYQIADTPVITEPAENGLDIYLTIDSNIQMYLDNAIEEMSKTSKFEWVHATIADAKTGAILGSTVTPSFDPNKMNITKYYNPIVSEAYEPGSTMKIFSFMAAMEEGLYDGSKTFSSGSMPIGEHRIYDWNKKGWGTISYDVGFTYSSNIAAANLGLEMGKDKLIEYYKKFGFGYKTGIEIAGEMNGTIKPNYAIELANASFGQGIATTPIQNVQAMTVLSNKGTLLRPYIVDKVINPDTGEVVYEGKRTEVSSTVSEEVINKMLELMYKTVNGDDPYATGRVYKTASTTLIGKTGTAQIASKSGGYEAGKYDNIRSFAGLFPYEDPKYIIYISVQKLEASSSAIAKPVKSIVESIAKYKNLDQLVVETDKTKIVDIKNYINKDSKTSEAELKSLGLETILIGDGDRIINQFPIKGATAVKGSKIFLLTNSENIIMPSMIGWTSNEVGNYCNLAEIDYNINGYGRVTSQSITEGSLVEKGSNIDFTLIRVSSDNEKESDDQNEETETGTKDEPENGEEHQE